MGRICPDVSDIMKDDPLKQALRCERRMISETSSLGSRILLDHALQREGRSSGAPRRRGRRVSLRPMEAPAHRPVHCGGRLPRKPPSPRGNRRWCSIAGSGRPRPRTAPRRAPGAGPLGGGERQGGMAGDQAGEVGRPLGQRGGILHHLAHQADRPRLLASTRRAVKIISLTRAAPTRAESGAGWRPTGNCRGSGDREAEPGIPRRDAQVAGRGDGRPAAGAGRRSPRSSA